MYGLSPSGPPPSTSAIPQFGCCLGIHVASNVPCLGDYVQVRGLAQHSARQMCPFAVDKSGGRILKPPDQFVLIGRPGGLNDDLSAVSKALNPRLTRPDVAPIVQYNKP